MKQVVTRQAADHTSSIKPQSLGGVFSDAVVKAFDHTSIGIIYVGLGGNIRCYNEKILEILDLTIIDGILPSYQELVTYVAKTVKNSKDIENLFTLPIKEYYQKQELVVETKNNRVLFCSSQAVIENGLIDGIVWSVSDITEHKTQERIATYRSLHDALTQLPNRTYLFKKLETLTDSTRERPKKFALLFLDLDDFKQINDEYGHAIGDQFLISCSSRIRNSLRVPDTLARLSGDEFVIILDEIDSHELVEKVIGRIYQSLSNSFHVSGTEIPASLSIGISFYPNESSNPRELIRQADKAMYQAKKRGKNTFCFYQASMESL
ncbi:MAG: GGDEF domain-containing protein [Gammaproteobacteria bacterium]|nr:GGDEF domain-containing protein [Gammaproteobacteria bacterium]